MFNLFFTRKFKKITRMLPSTFLVNSVVRKRSIKINLRKANDTSQRRILFFEIFAPKISKDILQNLKIAPPKSLNLKIFIPKRRKSKLYPK